MSAPRPALCCPGHGQEAERRFGRRYFSDLTAVFSAAPQFTVLHGREEIGTVDDGLLTEDVTGPRTLLLAGRSWEVTAIDWQRRQCWVTPSEQHGKATWGFASGGLSYELSRAMRAVLLGHDPANVTLTRRAERVFARLREEVGDTVTDRGTLVRRAPSGELRWWTWAGSAVNRTVLASLPGVVDPRQRAGDRSVRLRPEVTRRQFLTAISSASVRNPEVNEASIAGLKFSAALPTALAIETVATRLGDREHTAEILNEPISFVE